MPVRAAYRGYRSFSYLEPGRDFRSFDLAKEVDRVEPSLVPLGESGEERVTSLVASSLMISLHEHVGVFPDRIDETPDYVREGRMATAFEGLAHSQWDAVFDNLLDGICCIHSRSGWKWTEVLHDLGMRLCDLAHRKKTAHLDA